MDPSTARGLSGAKLYPSISISVDTVDCPDVILSLDTHFQVFRVCSSVRFVRSDRKGVAVAVEPKAGRMRHPQQRARDADAPVELARVADVPGHVDCVVTCGGEAGGDVAGRSGRLASRALGRVPFTANAAHPATAPRSIALLRAQPAR